MGLQSSAISVLCKESFDRCELLRHTFASLAENVGGLACFCDRTGAITTGADEGPRKVVARLGFTLLRALAGTIDGNRPLKKCQSFGRLAVRKSEATKAP